MFKFVCKLKTLRSLHLLYLIVWRITSIWKYFTSKFLSFVFIFQQQLSFITSTYSIVQSQNSVQESHVRPWQCAIRKSIFTITGFPWSLQRCLGEDLYLYYMAPGKCFTADLCLVRPWPLCILFFPLSSEGRWKSGFVEDQKDKNLWLFWAGFVRSDQRGRLPRV